MPKFTQTFLDALQAFIYKALRAVKFSRVFWLCVSIIFKHLKKAGC
jgi:hypothetical protein